MNVDKTTDSVDYWIFLMILSNYVEMWIQKYSESVKLIIDNASIHLSLSSKRTAMFYNFEIHSFLPFPPNLAPEEMVFGICKKTIVKSLQNKVINFSKPGWQKGIITSLKIFDKSTVINLWRKFIKEAKYCIIKSKKEYLEKKMMERFL